MSESQEPEWITLAADIRAVDGNHDLGAASLAAALIARGWSRAIDRAALVAAVARLFDSREVELADDPATNRATVLALLNTLPAAPTIDSATLPPHTRLILASENLLDEWGGRTLDGAAITVEWGDPQPEGWYGPQFTVQYDDRLGLLDSAWRRVEEALPEGWDMGFYTEANPTDGEGPFMAWAEWPSHWPQEDDVNEPRDVRVGGPTLALALDALADALLHRGETGTK